MTAGSFRFPALTAVVVANMVGAGVFTSLGFQLLEIRSGFVLLALWAAGGLAALCGAVSYAELGAALPRSGGEYNFLGRIYHPAAGFVSGWVSATVGFAAPTALAAMTFAAYASSSLPGGGGPALEKAMACALLLALTATHAAGHRASGGAQLGLTAVKVAVIAAFVAGVALAAADPQPVRFLPTPGDGALLAGGAFAVSLIYVSYAYSGWNAATYLSGELEDPRRTLPWILLGGAAVVTLLYLGLNFAFLRAAPMDSMAGEVEVGVIAAEAAFGPAAGRLSGIVLALLLVSTVSAMTMAGPRVIQVVGEDFPVLGFLARRNRRGIPATAIAVQSAVALLFILSSTFESVLVLAGFTMALNAFAAVAGVFVLRLRRPELPRPYRIPLYPLPPLLFLLVTGWALVFTLAERPAEGLFGLGLVGSGLALYLLASARGRRRVEDLP